MDESIYIKCQCGGCNILEMQWCPEDKQFYMAVWVMHPGELPMIKKERIRWCDNVMKTGKPWADHTIISKDDAKRISKFINKYVK